MHFFTGFLSFHVFGLTRALSSESTDYGGDIAKANSSFFTSTVNASPTYKHPCNEVTAQRKNANYSIAYCCSTTTNYSIIGVYYNTCTEYTVQDNLDHEPAWKNNDQMQKSPQTCSVAYCCDWTYSHPTSFETLCIAPMNQTPSTEASDNLNKPMHRGHGLYQRNGRIQTTNQEQRKSRNSGDPNCFISPIVSLEKGP